MAYTAVFEGKRDEAFIASESNGFRSRSTVNLKAGAAYEAGSVLAPEAGNTGFHVLASAASPAAVVLCRATDATAAATEAAVIARDAEVKAGELVTASGVSVADVTDALAANGVIVRSSF